MDRLPPARQWLAFAVLAAPLLLLGLRTPSTPQMATPVGGDSASIAKAPTEDAAGAQPEGAGGESSLRGVVVDSSGNPVAGARVRARLELGPGATSRAPQTAGPETEATTTDAGAFSFAGLAPGRYHLTLTGASLFPSELRLVSVPQGDMRILVSRRVEVTGIVVDGDTAIARATVELAGATITGRRRVQTDDAGRFTLADLPEGNYQVRAVFRNLASATLGVPRIGPGPTAELRIGLAQAAVVVATVVDADSGAGVAAAVELRSIDQPDELPYFVTSHSDGAVRIEGVPHGRWAARAWAPGVLEGAAVELEAGRGATRIDVQRGAVLSGQVRAPDGRPLAGVAIRVTPAAEPSRTLSSAQLDADRKARFTGTGVIAGQVSSATPGFASASFEPRGELGVMRGPIPMPPPPGASVGVPQPTLAPVAAGVDAPDIPAAVAAQWVTDADGRFRATGVGPGRVVVRASAPAFAETASAILVAQPPQDVADVSITLDLGTWLVGTVRDTRGDVVVGATLTANIDGLQQAQVTDASGAYRLGPVRGQVDLDITAHGRAGTRIRVDTQGAPRTGPGGDEVRTDVTLAIADAELIGDLVDPRGAAVIGARISAKGGPSTASTASGFQLTGLAEGNLELLIEHPDYPPLTLRATTGTRPRLTLPFGGGIALQVHDRATGEPLVAVTARAEGPGPERTAATDERGWATFRALAPGAWTLRVVSPGYLPSETTVSVVAGDRVDAITVDKASLAVERGAHLAGMVRDRFGQRVQRAELVARRVDGTGPVARAQSNADGEFRFRDAPTGRVRIQATAANQEASLELEVRPGDEQFSLIIDLP